MSLGRHEIVPTVPTSSDPETCEEFGYGLGDPGGILVLRYTCREPLAFDGTRQDFLHHLWWSPDGPLAVSGAGIGTRVLAPDEGLWVRRGTSHTVHAPGPQQVFRTCLREVPARLEPNRLAVVAVGREIGEVLLGLTHPGTPVADALGRRALLMATLRPAEGGGAVGGSGAGTGPAADVARALFRDPADPTTLQQWAARQHVAVRTLQRDFEREFGVPWSRWRTQVRLEVARALLPGRSVTEVAHHVGYSSASAFVNAYARAYGRTPGADAAGRSPTRSTR